MGLYQKLPDDITEVDVVVAGGGTAGCIVASRLASADPSMSVLVLEGGQNNWQDPSIINVGLFIGHIMPGAPHTAFYPSKPSEHLNGRGPVVPAGGVLGGGSSINMAMYSRPVRSDFDAWDMPGWTADDMLPFMRKLETYHGKGSADVHGYDGPVQVSMGSYVAQKAQNYFIDAIRKAGYQEVDDMQDLSAVNAFSRANRYVSPDDKRQDTAHTYLHPRLQDGKHPNLHAVVESQVSRVLVENGRAAGVVFQPSTKLHPEDTAERTVRARKMVVVSCGAFGTPMVLERSGVGRPEILSKAGVELVAENPGVGIGYEDHHLISGAYKTSLDEEDTMNGIIYGTLSPEVMLTEKKHLLGYNAQDCSGKIRPTDAEAAALGPEFDKAWKDHFQNKPDKPLAGIAMVNAIPGDPRGAPPGQYMGITTFSLYPFSRGHVHITGPKIDDPVDFETGFLADAEGIDVKKHVWIYKKQREIMRRLGCYRGEVPSYHPDFPTDSAAALTTTDVSLPDDVEDIEYSADDDKIIEKYVRDTADTTWHSMGTCKMKPREKGGAVDGSLSVYGVEGLKVADLSIAPGNVGCNTNNTALAIGERAADLFIRELGLAN